FGRFGGVVEGMYDPADDLTLFMPFSGDHDHISFAHQRDGVADGLATVADLQRVGTAGADLSPDGGGVFGTRVVVGDDGCIGQTPGDLAHQGTLGPVAVAARAEDDDQPTRRVGTQGVQHRLQPVGRVGVVDIDLAPAPSFAGDALQAPLR